DPPSFPTRRSSDLCKACFGWKGCSHPFSKPIRLRGRRASCTQLLALNSLLDRDTISWLSTSPALTATAYWRSGLHGTATMDHALSATDTLLSMSYVSDSRTTAVLTRGATG